MEGVLDTEIMKESDITKSIIQFLRACGCFCYKHWAGPMGRKGVSDIIGCLPDGRFLAVEVKTDRGRVSQFQEQFIQDVNRSGGLGFVARSVREVRDRLGTAGVKAKQRRLFPRTQGIGKSKTRAGRGGIISPDFVNRVSTIRKL